MSEDRVEYQCPRNLEPAAIVRRLADGLAPELAGLNVDEPLRALRYAEDRLGNELQLVRLALELEQRKALLGGAA